MYKMKYYAQIGSEYRLTRDKLTLFWLLLGGVLLFAVSTLFEGSSVDEKVAFWTARVFCVLLLLGAVSKWVGVPYTLLGCGVLCVVVALLYRPKVPVIARLARKSARLYEG